MSFGEEIPLFSKMSFGEEIGLFSRVYLAVIAAKQREQWWSR